MSAAETTAPAVNGSGDRNRIADLGGVWDPALLERVADEALAHYGLGTYTADPTGPSALIESDEDMEEFMRRPWPPRPELVRDGSPEPDEAPRTRRYGRAEQAACEDIRRRVEDREGEGVAEPVEVDLLADGPVGFPDEIRWDTWGRNRKVRFTADPRLADVKERARQRVYRDTVDRSDLPSGAKRVAGKVAGHADADGSWAFPESATIADETGLHVRTVERHIRRLREEGWLRVVPCFDRRGSPRQALYALTVPADAVMDVKPGDRIEREATA